MTTNLDSRTHQEVQTYYGETLESSADLKTSACCTSAAPPGYLREIIAAIHPEVNNRYYGCGLVLPEALAGLKVLDLGCGAGRDVYLLSKLVGANGQVAGVDMTPAQLKVAEQYRDYHAAAFGYDESNVQFLEGNIERLDDLPLEDASFDLIISNCVINLAVDKAAVLRSVKRLLKPGGEMYFSDIYADRRIPADLTRDPVLYGECLSGALYWKDFLQLATASGLAAPRLVESEPLDMGDPEVQAKIGEIRFCSATFRLFRLAEQEPGAEDYGQEAVYRGTLPESPEVFQLDQDYVFCRGERTPVSGNTFRLIGQTRFRGHFQLFGDFSCHIGEYDNIKPKLCFTAQGQNGGCC